MKLIMGNEAIAISAINAGVRLAAGYPGTPSTEVLETIAAESKRNKIHDIHIEWSVNEKAALEVAAGASIAGLRTIVTMKQVGLNVASDPLMSLSYIGVKGGMIILVADDPGPISSQTEQDTRTFAAYSKLPCLDPSCPEEAFDMVPAAFQLSEQYGTPVILRPTTRVCHASYVYDGEINPSREQKSIGFEKDPKWVIFPRLSRMAHERIEKRNPEIGQAFSDSPFNAVCGNSKLAIACGGVTYAYVQEALSMLNAECKLIKIGTPFPFPYSLAKSALYGCDEVICLEELDPVIERELIHLSGRAKLPITVRGKLSGDVPAAGELSTEICLEILGKYLSVEREPTAEANSTPKVPALPVRAPVLCAGCPHRASFYAVKRAMSGKKAIFCGDIGCYTLGNAAPLDMVDTCLCMGAGITEAQGLAVAEPDAVCFAFIGDSTFFASGITGAVNAVYNGSNIVLVVLDNSLTAMTGGQPNPGMGITITGDAAPKLSIRAVLSAIGVDAITVNPLNLKESIDAVKDVVSKSGVRAIIFESPCATLIRGRTPLDVDDSKCIDCGKCSRELGCPAISLVGGKANIDSGLCNGCGLCTQVCSVGAISEDERGN